MLLFPRGQRPDGCVLRAAVEQTKRTRLVHELDGGATLELLRDGLTYDLVGLAPGPGIESPPARHRFGADGGSATGAFEAVALQPGDHIVAGAHTMPVVRTLAGIASELIPHLSQLAAVAWPPAGTHTGPAFFASTVEKWLEGGAFPALGLTAFALADDGELRSEGLAWFTGQEIALDASLAGDRAAATRLAMRLVNQLVGRGAVDASELIVGPDGERLLLCPAENGAVVRVRRG